MHLTLNRKKMFEVKLFKFDRPCYYLVNQRKILLSHPNNNRNPKKKQDWVAFMSQPY